MLDDQPASSDNAQQPKTPYSDGSKERFVHQPNGGKAEQQPGDKQQESNDGPKPILPVRVWRWVVTWWTDPHRPRGNFPEHVTVLVSVVIAGIALLQWSVYRQQKRIMESSGHQTDQLIAYAKAQACAAQSFATSAANINVGIATAVSKLNLQAEKLDANVTQASRLADDTEKANANIINSERPWMGAAFTVDGFAAGKTPTYSVISMNSGKRPAKITLAQSLAVNRDFGENPVYKPYDQSPSTTVVVPGQGFANTWKDDSTIMNPIQKDLMTALDGGTPFRVYFKIEYTDISTLKKYWTHACWRYNKIGTGNSGNFSNCSEYNDAK